MTAIDTLILDGISTKTLAECVGVLRYLKAEFDAGFRIDAINMEHVDRVLTIIDVEQSIKRVEKIAPAIRLAAE